MKKKKKDEENGGDSCEFLEFNGAISLNTGLRNLCADFLKTRLIISVKCPKLRIFGLRFRKIAKLVLSVSSYFLGYLDGNRARDLLFSFGRQRFVHVW